MYLERIDHSSINVRDLSAHAFRTGARRGLQEAQEVYVSLGSAFDPPEDTGIAYSILVIDRDGNQIEIA
jgi:hypothetical protein